MLITAIVAAGIVVFIFAPTFYFMITKRSKKSIVEVYSTESENYVDDPGEDISNRATTDDFEQDSHSLPNSEKIKDSRNPMDHFK